MPSKRTCFSTHVCLIQANSAGELNLLRFFWVWGFFFEDARRTAPGLDVVVVYPESADVCPL